MELLCRPNLLVRWQDYYDLGGIAQAMAIGQKDMESIFTDYVAALSPLPEIEPDKTNAERKEILAESWRANAVIAYIAAVQYMDAQVQKILNELDNYPTIKNNTVIIFIGDNGFSFGEKHHWLKRSLWEIDIRVPMIIVDPSIAGNIMSYRTVSLLDIYPTLCEMAGVEYPHFSDGSNYLDGHSLVPLLINPDTCWEYPALITFEAEDNKESSCFPQHTVRSEKFSYIKYQSDNENLTPNAACDWSGSVREEELYEVGVMRETDPEEWNNLISKAEYKSVVNYLSQFLPDSNLYLQKAYSAHINEINPQCIYDKGDTIFFQVSICDPNGTPIEIPSDFIAQWSTNATMDLYFGNQIHIPVNSLPDDFFDLQKRVILYFNLIETSTQITYGFDLYYAYINPTHIPIIQFNVVEGGISTVYITDFEMSGNYNALRWDMGDGTTLFLSIPFNYTYNAPGNNEITCYAEYSNKECEIAFSANAIIDDSASEFIKTLLIYPNPADRFTYVSNGKYFDNAKMELWSLSGALVFKSDYLNGFYLKLNTELLNPGVYLLKVESTYGYSTGRLVILH